MCEDSLTTNECNYLFTFEDILEPEYVIDEQATIRGADIEKVYDDCLVWLKKIHANIIIQKRPEFIKAFHLPPEMLTQVAGEAEFWNWHPKNWEKIIDLFFYKINDHVRIRFIIERPEGFHTEAAINKRRRWWVILVLDLYKSLNIEVDSSHEKKFFPFNNLRKMKSDIWRSFTLPLFGSLVMFVWGFHIIHSDSSIGYIFILAAVFIPIRVIYENFLIRKRMRELYPDR